MIVNIDNAFDLFVELRSEPSLSGAPLASELCTHELRPLVDEALTAAVLSGRLPPDANEVHAKIEPVWKQQPVLEGVTIELTSGANGHGSSYRHTYTSGGWVRNAIQRTAELREDGTLAESQSAYRLLVGLANERASVSSADLQLPIVADGTLVECGVRDWQAESMTPDRPVLVNRRFVDDAVRMCEAADVLETGGAVLGRMIRLEAPLPNTTSRVVTVLSSIVPDDRHVGSATRFELNPMALAEAQQMADMRGLGEQVITVFHTHGWNGKCGNCNASETCPIVEATPSVHDYRQLLDQLFTSKTTLLPIAGRKLGAAGRRPVLQVHAWRGGEMRAIRYGTYQD